MMHEKKEAKLSNQKERRKFDSIVVFDFVLFSVRYARVCFDFSS